MKLHGKDTGHNCQYCKKVMLSGATSKSHEATCTSKPGYVDNRVTCGFCQKKYNSDKILQNHMRTIHGPPVGSLKCDHWGSDKFTGLNNLKLPITECEKIQTKKCFTAWGEDVHPRITNIPWWRTGIPTWGTNMVINLFPDRTGQFTGPFHLCSGYDR